MSAQVQREFEVNDRRGAPHEHGDPGTGKSHLGGLSRIRESEAGGFRCGLFNIGDDGRYAFDGLQWITLIGVYIRKLCCRHEFPVHEHGPFRVALVFVGQTDCQGFPFPFHVL